MPEVFVDIPEHAPLTFPGHPTAPLGGQPQTEHLAITHLGWRSATGGHLGPNMTLVDIIHYNVQCGEEGFEIEVHGHVSFGERSDMAIDSRRNLLARPGTRDQYASRV